jgi:hypothetical protein
MGTLRTLGALLAAGAVSALTAGTTLGQPAGCRLADRSADEVLPGVTLTRDSSFLCTDASESATYEIAITVRNAAASAEAAEIVGLRLSHTTPRPGGRGPEATAQAEELPSVVAPGERDSFRVFGRYELVATDEGKKANLHLLVSGRGVASGERFRLGIAVHLRGAGAAESDGPSDEARKGPPPWAGGPPPWAGAR